MSKLRVVSKRLKRKNKSNSFQRKLKKLSPNWQASIVLASIILLLSGYAALAQDNLPTENMVSELKVGLDTLWVVLASVLVIFMNAGFAMLETGFCRRKNAVNLLAKNLIVFAISTLAFWSVGFALMFGDGNSVFGSNGFFLNGSDNSPAIGDEYQGVYSSLNWTGVPLAAKFLFQVAFAGTAATIVSGAVAERIKFLDFILFSFLLVSFCYPLVGHWVWGGGWLAEMGFWDFAGSTVVHSVGGWAALLGAAILGPRIGKYRNDDMTLPLPGHNLGLATLGAFILWIGWFGFNPGSTMAVDGSIARIALTTNLAAAAGGTLATATCWFITGKPDLSMIINGVLAGLVAITASCAFVSYQSAVLIGCIAGILVVLSVFFFDSINIDDPVGAISVHLINGIWGTLAVGLFANPDIYGNGNGPEAGLFISGDQAQIGVQILGIAAVGVMVPVSSAIFWLVLKAIFGLRVSEEEELQGLDMGEHGIEAYSGFSQDTNEMN